MASSCEPAVGSRVAGGSFSPTSIQRSFGEDPGQKSSSAAGEVTFDANQRDIPKMFSLKDGGQGKGGLEIS